MNTNTLKPSCGCWKSSSAKETQLSSSEKEIKYPKDCKEELLLRLYRHQICHTSHLVGNWCFSFLLPSCFWLKEQISSFCRAQREGFFFLWTCDWFNATQTHLLHRRSWFPADFIRGRFSRLSKMHTNNLNSFQQRITLVSLIIYFYPFECLYQSRRVIFFFTVEVLKRTL